MAIGVKHGNACGAGIGSNTISVITRMIEGDPLALFGGVVMFNFPCGEKEARALRRAGMEGSTKRIIDCVIAPSFTADAIDELSRKGGKCRLLANPALEKLSHASLDVEPRRRYVRGGYLEQPNYTFVLKEDDPLIEIHGAGSIVCRVDLFLAWAIGCTSNSNTIAVVNNRRLIANAVGQQDRVGSAELALARAKRSGNSTQGATAYSDSFFPFPDGPKLLADAGILTLCATKGSVNDELVKEVCVKSGLTLVWLPDTHARGFFGH